MAQWSGGSWHLVRDRVRVRVRVSNKWADRAEAAGTGAATIRTHRLPAAAAPRARRWSASPLASASHRPCRCRTPRMGMACARAVCMACAWRVLHVLCTRHVLAMCMACVQHVNTSEISPADAVCMACVCYGATNHLLQAQKRRDPNPANTLTSRNTHTNTSTNGPPADAVRLACAWYMHVLGIWQACARHVHGIGTAYLWHVNASEISPADAVRLPDTWLCPCLLWRNDHLQAQERRNPNPTTHTNAGTNGPPADAVRLAGEPRRGQRRRQVGEGVRWRARRGQPLAVRVAVREAAGTGAAPSEQHCREA